MQQNKQKCGILKIYMGYHAFCFAMVQRVCTDMRTV